MTNNPFIKENTGPEEEEEYVYHLLYKPIPKPEGVTKEQIPKDHLACDSGLVAVVLNKPDGTAVVSFRSLDGKTGEELDPHMQFMIWATLAHHLAKAGLPNGPKSLCEYVDTVITNAAQAAIDTLKDESN